MKNLKLKHLLASGKNCSFPNDCFSNEICQDGQCVIPSCVDDKECHYGKTCQNGICKEKTCESNSNGSCSNGGKCMDGTCVLPSCSEDGKNCQCKEDKECSIDKICYINPCLCSVGQCTKPIQSK